MDPRLFGPIDVEVGQSVSGVFQLGEVHDGWQHGFRVPDGRPVCVAPPCSAEEGRYSVYNLQDVLLPLWHLTRTADTQVFRIDRDALAFSPHVVELCAGFGGMGIGASHLGGQTILCADHNNVVCNHLAANHARVLKLDLNLPAAAQQIHQACGNTAATFVLGFPCQPYSSQGRRLGTLDPRARTLWSGLHVAFMLQCQALILECVVAARHHPDVRKALSSFASAMNFDLLEVELDLCSQWPCRRRRWWALLLPKQWHSTGLHSWPPSSLFTNIGSVIGNWPAWPADEEASLLLDSVEINRYTDPSLGHDKRELSLDDISPTILHSYGNALQACPCYCRLQGFSEASLASKGLRGFFVRANPSGLPRFLHHKEAAILLGVPSDIQYVLPPRANLALLGLIASPLQSAWVYASLLANFAQATNAIQPISPRAAIQSLQDRLLRQWRLQQPQTAPAHISLTVHRSDGPEVFATTFATATADSVMLAERIHTEWGSTSKLTQLHNEHCTTAVWTHQRRKKQRILPPTQPVDICIIHEDVMHCTTVAAGSFLFEPLRHLGISANFLWHHQLGLIGADTRVWLPITVSTFSPQALGVQAQFRLAHGGPSNNPGPGLAEDFLWHILQQIAGTTAPSAADPVVCLLHPGLDEAIHKPPHHQPTPATFQSLSAAICAQHTHPTCLVVGLFIVHGHWITLAGDCQSHTILWTYYDGLGPHLISQVTQLASDLTRLLGATFGGLLLADSLRQDLPWTCGTIALAHALHLITSCDLPQPHQIAGIHQELVRAQGPVSCPLGLGPTNTAALLTTHGVPANLADERAQLAIGRLGLNAVQQALAAPQPWTELKAKANTAATMFRLVLPSELSAHVQARSQSQFGTAIFTDKKKSKGKGERRPRPTPAQPDPADLSLFADSFVDAKQLAVPPLPFHAVTADVRGVAICTAQQALPFIKAGKRISPEALALVINEPVEAPVGAEIAPLIFPAQYQGTGEPVLLRGALLQLGDIAVSRKAANVMPQPEVVLTQVLRIQVYRDLFDQWDTFAEAPICELVRLTPPLKLCRDSQCLNGAHGECKFTHPAIDEEFDQVIMEVWGRAFMTLDGKRTQPTEAATFMAFIRVPLSAVRSILTHQPKGAFIEPLLDARQGVDPTYRVVWIPGADYDQVLHIARTFTKSLSLMRLKQRFGIRVLAKDLQAAHETLRPGTPFNDIAVNHIFQLFPIPHGTQRSSVAKLLEDWQWEAKPLQPGRGNSDAMSWTVGASKPPSGFVLPGFGADVLITETKTKAHDRLNITASRRTQDHICNGTPTPQSGGSSDPWLEPGGDPWSRCSKNTAFAPPGLPTPSAITKTRLDEIAKELKAEVQATLRSEVAGHQAMTDDPDTQSRLHKLETDITEIKSHNQHFNQWFNQVSAQHQQLENVVSTVQATLSTHQHELSGLRQEHQQSQERIWQSMQGLRQDLATDMGARFDSIEAMLCKRPRANE